MPKELTLRGLVLGSLLTVVFTAANVYLGLKVGLTFASSIPAAVISMAILSVVKDSSILENNIVQTVASAAGTLSAIIFVLPGLVIVGWWTGFPFWTSSLVCIAGGILGVVFTIPLRRALVTTSDLPYPEGVAAAEVLKVGSGRRGEIADDTGEAREGLMAVIYGSVSSAGLAVFAATRIGAGGVSGFFRVAGNAASGYDVAFSLALLGAGHLVGLSVGMAMLVGLLISWVGALPILTYLQPAAAGVTLAAHAEDVWRHQVRFIGAGTIAIAAIWTLAKLARPVVGGLVSTLASSRARATGDELDRDLSPAWIVGLTVACLALSAALVARFLIGTPLASSTTTLILIAVPFVLVAGFLIAAICGYMAGLIGASNSPISGVGILSIVSCATILAVAIHPTDAMRPSLVAFALFVTAIVFACATISNDNLQDLKTGQLVGASPRRQQIALIVGVIAGALVIPVILNLLAKSNGFAGAPNIGVIAKNPLAAPQATLISALARGVIGGDLDWKMIGIGLLVGLGVIIVDETLGVLKRLRIPPLAVGIGIYLPMSATFAVIVGSIIGHWYNQRVKGRPEAERLERVGVLVASGLIVGESLFGVLNSGLIVATGKEFWMGLVPADGWLWRPIVDQLAPIVDQLAPAHALGAISFIALIVVLYRWMLGRGPTRRA
ncbi:MAG TPA: oligopeptide transporter, OPT family [Candidatus Acidoferrum sp.]|nr:oligopeptide transporter, OPT family [Candidatus Acidoferrum sp.]